MKKVLTLIFVLSITLICSTSVFADVIWEPEDDFYWANADDCIPVNRTYIAASSNEAINVYVSPQNSTVVNTILNDTELYISWSWNEWYYYDIGWIHSDDVALIYDGISFLQNNEVTEYSAEAISIPSAQLYTYPNSGNSYELIEEKDYALIGESFSSAFTDENGLTWGYISYYMQHEGWVCVDDPTNTSFNSAKIPTEQSISQKRGSDAEVGEPPFSLLIIATILVILVVAVTVIMINIKKKKAR